MEEISRVVPDCALGTIPPFGALYGVRSFIDRRVLVEPEVTMPAGDPGAPIRMRSAEFSRIVGAQVGDFAVPEALVAAGGSRPGRTRSRGGPARQRRRRGQRPGGA